VHFEVSAVPAHTAHSNKSGLSFLFLDCFSFSAVRFLSNACAAAAWMVSTSTSGGPKRELLAAGGARIDVIDTSGTPTPTLTPEKKPTTGPAD
jgi:hypothetical protein